MNAYGVILAAGESRRMNEPKGLLDFYGQPWLLRQIEEMKKFGLKKIIVVLGKHFDDYREALPQLFGAENNEHVLFKLNKDWVHGPFSSLQCGLAHSHQADNIFVLPVDCPWPSAKLAQMLAQTRVTHNCDAAIPIFQGRGGHPVVLSSTFASRLLSCNPLSSRLDFELRNLGLRCVRVTVDDTDVVENFNDKTSWQEFCRRRKHLSKICSP